MAALRGRKEEREKKNVVAGVMFLDGDANRAGRRPVRLLGWLLVDP